MQAASAGLSVDRYSMIMRRTAGIFASRVPAVLRMSLSSGTVAWGKGRKEGVRGIVAPAACWISGSDLLQSNDVERFLSSNVNDAYSRSETRMADYSRAGFDLTPEREEESF